MAKQSGVVKISGNIDDLTFSNTKNGHTVRKKGRVVTKDDIATGKQYARVRENMDEFGRATEAARLFRTAFNESMTYCVDKTLITRSATIMRTVLSSDPVSDRGARNVMNGDAGLLKDFLLNSKINFGNICKKEYSTSIDRTTGKLTFGMGAFVPANVISAAAKSTHFRFYSAAAAIDFNTGEYELAQAESAWMPVAGKDPTAAVTQEHQLTPGSTRPLFLVAGIIFSQEVNGKYYPFYNAAFNSLCVANAASV